MNNTTRWAWKAVNLDLTTRNGFTWPVGGEAKAPGPFSTSTVPCPKMDGDGLCLAKTPGGAASGGYGVLSSMILLVSFDPGDVLGEDADKVRVKKCRTHGPLNAKNILLVPGVNLSWANLSKASLYGANLSGANLSGANLSGANLSGANLSKANLSKANLSKADFSWADLSGTDFSGADLTGADFSGAYGISTALMPARWVRG